MLNNAHFFIQKYFLLKFWSEEIGMNDELGFIFAKYIAQVFEETCYPIMPKKRKVFIVIAGI